MRTRTEAWTRMKAQMTLTLVAFVTALTGVVAQTDTPLVTSVRWSDIPTEATVSIDLSGRKRITIPELPVAPQLDGDLSDEAWQHAAQTDPWMVNTGAARAIVQTTAWLGVYGGRLFVGVRAEEPNVPGIVADVTEDGGPVWNDDCIELFVDGDLDLQTARQLVINSVGTVTLIDHAGGDWNTDVARAARVGEDAWFVELSIPLSALGLTGAEFGLNICRERRAGGGTELSCWAPTGGSFHQPGKFGLASLPVGYLRRITVDTAQLGDNRLTVALQNPDDRRRDLRVRLTWWQGDGIGLERTVGPFALAPEEIREVSIDYVIERADVPVEMEVVVLDEQGHELARREISQAVRDVLAMTASRFVMAAGEKRMFVRARLTLNEDALERSRLVVALFRQPDLALVGRSEFAPPGGRVMWAELRLPPLAPGTYSLHVVLKRNEGTDARRIAEEKTILHVLEPVSGE